MKVVLTKRAQKNFEKIYNYIATRFGLANADEFDESLEFVFEVLLNNPEAGQSVSESKPVRVFLHHKHTEVFYRLSQNQLVILALFDVRQDPMKQPK